MEFIRERTFPEPFLELRHLSSIGQVVVALREAVANPQDEEVRGTVERTLTAAKGMVDESRLKPSMGFAAAVFTTAESFLKT